MVPMDSLERCIVAHLHLEEIEADGARFESLGPNPVADRLLGILWHQSLELDLHPLMFEEGGAGGAEHASEFLNRRSEVSWPKPMPIAA